MSELYPAINKPWRVRARAFLDLLYPRQCAVCGVASDRPQGYLCWECFRSIDLVQGSMCECCGFGIESRVDHTFLCSRCRDDPPRFDKARVAGRFRGVLRDLLLNFKYNQGLWLCNDLVDVLHGCVTAYFEAAAIDLVVPIPLAPIKQRSRSYNQAGELGRELARRLNRQFSHDALKRVRATATQTRLGASARVANMRDAFDINVPGWVRGRTVLLVDDVMTTGATLNEAARVLRANGATRVWATAVARG